MTEQNLFYRHDETVDLLNKITTWGEARNLIQGATPFAQFVKLMEENGEVAEGIIEENNEKLQDGIGDVVVVATILAAQHGTTILECLQYYNENQEDELCQAPIDDLELSFAYYAGILASGIAKKNIPRVKIGLAHVFMISEMRSVEYLEKPLIECIQSSYDEIKDRKGKMVDGVFVKEADFHIFGIAE